MDPIHEHLNRINDIPNIPEQTNNFRSWFVRYFMVAVYIFIIFVATFIYWIINYIFNRQQRIHDLNDPTSSTIVSLDELEAAAEAEMKKVNAAEAKLWRLKNLGEDTHEAELEVRTAWNASNEAERAVEEAIEDIEVEMDTFYESQNTEGETLEVLYGWCTPEEITRAINGATQTIVAARMRATYPDRAREF